MRVKRDLWGCVGTGFRDPSFDSSSTLFPFVFGRLVLKIEY